MHEVSILMSVMDIALEEAQKADAKRINSITLEVGEKSGVVIDSLNFAFELVIQDTIAESAKLHIHSIPFKGQCVACGHYFEGGDFLTCDLCGNFGKIISGQELKIKSIEVD